jgi:hypothetical protein
MATVEDKPLLACDGFRAEASRGLLGWVEETWLGKDDEPGAFALRLVDGRRALILAAEVEAVVAEREQVAVRDGARMLELGTPHLERVAVDGGPPRLAASWQTTGEVLAPPKPPGKLRHALLELRPWRLAPPPAPGGEQTVGQALLLLLPLLGLLIAFEITLAFAVAYLVTGRAY